MPGRRASEASYLSEQRLGNAPQKGCNAVATLSVVLRLQIWMKSASSIFVVLRLQKSRKFR